jgi:hypothetical protein
VTDTLSTPIMLACSSSWFQAAVQHLLQLGVHLPHPSPKLPQLTPCGCYAARS